MKKTKENGFRLSPRVTLYKGDKLRISGGSFMLVHGVRTPMTDNGVCVFDHVEGNIMYVHFPKFSHPRVVYIGENTVAPNPDGGTAIFRRRPKIVKLRK